MKISYVGNGNNFDPFDKELEIKGEEGRPFYAPEPQDLSDIPLPTKLEGLVEKLAENMHASWACEKIGDGWKYAPVYDETHKTTPRLARYSDLSDEDRRKDRNAARDILKLIIKSGHDIV